MRGIVRENPGPVTIAHVSDFHLGAHDAAAMESLVTDVRATRPALTVITGDLTMRARATQFVQASVLLGRLPSPQLVVLGNHDVPLALIARLRAPYRRYQAHVDITLNPFLEIPGLVALGVNSMPWWRWKNGRVSRQQSIIVGEAFGRAAPRAVRLLALHHPLSARGLARVLGRDELLHALAGAHVDLVLAGHTHVPAVQRLPVPDNLRGRSILEVTAGTATSKRVRGAGHSWTLVHVDVDTIYVFERHRTASGWRGRRSVAYPRHPR